ncbi:hypothetical protein [Enterococcus canintestini]|uniref:WxL domain-containing protein n=1 Tax=Enterococcus canintestini TaxID=317010 RepID=A0A267HQH8_9ENTE|nr:hypothetical protein [Enterococcus canintestini]PAB00502.1 hypothetical protein AKL21_08405 [Enterococcus canintestini]
MKKIFGLVALSSIVLMALPAYAEQDIIGENSGNIEVNGTLGMDNTVEEAEIVEGTDQWINVTLPLKTIFYSTSPKAGATITSPDYTITNNSGRPVDIHFKGIAKDDPDPSAKADYMVELNGFGKANPKIIENGLATPPSSRVLIHTLGNNNKKLGKDDDLTEETDNTVTFGYVGEVTDAMDDDTITENYIMTLEFEAVSWPEDTP